MERIELEGTGFTVMKDYADWRVALITYEYSKNSLEGFKNFGKHNETDEVFVLLEGEAKMVLGGYEDNPKNLKVETLNKNEAFVVNCKEWHAILVQDNSKVLVIENRNTGLENTDNEDVTKEERKKIKEILNFEG